MDIGCGPGFFTILLSQARHEVIGIDGSQDMLREAQAKAQVCSVAPAFFQMDAHKPEFPENSFDLIVSRNVTHILQEHRLAYGEWLRLLRPGGRLLIFDANWHLVKTDPVLREESLRRYKDCVKRYGDAFDRKMKNKDTGRTFNLKEGHILGDIRRPDWDIGLLLGLGYEGIYVERDITGEMWDEKEHLLYGNTPMFMIRAEKCAYPKIIPSIL